MAEVLLRVWLARGVSVLVQDALHTVPELTVYDGFVLAGVALALVEDFAEIAPVRQYMVNVGLLPHPAAHRLALAARPGLHAMALPVQFPGHQHAGAQPAEALEDVTHEPGFGLVDQQAHPLAVHVVAQQRPAADVLALLLGNGDLIPDALAAELALELRERQQDVQRQAPHGTGGIEPLRDGYEGHVVLLEQGDQLREVHQTAGEPIDLVDHHDVHPVRLDVGQEGLEARAVHVPAGEAAVIVVCGDRLPALVLLAGDVRLTGFALGVEAVERLFEPFLVALARVDGAADGPGLLVLRDHDSSLAGPASPKNRGPLTCCPVMALATADSVR